MARYHCAFCVKTVVSLLVLTTALHPPQPARAGISSWLFSDDKDKAKTTPDATAPKAVQRPSGAPATGQSGGDAAYRAFDSGKYLTALDLAEKAAKTGDPAAHTLIGRIYSEGLGVAVDDAVAAQWFKRGAELGDVNAMFALGLMFARGRGVEKNYETAATLFEGAAKTGHPEANYNLGLLFLNGSGKPKNVHRAARHIAYAAEKQVAAAQYDLAGLYALGAGVPHDAYEQARWLAKAAEQGMPEAQYEYAVLLLKGFGIRMDEPKAIPYLKQAAAKGIAGAQNRLAYVYEEGIGVSKDPVEMAKWRFLAKEAGFEDIFMDNKVAKLPKETRLMAQKAAADFRSRALLEPLSVK